RGVSKTPSKRKTKPQEVAGWRDGHRPVRISSSQPKPQIANRSGAKALLQLAHDFRFGHAFQLVMQSGLQDVHVENAVSQSNWAGMSRDKFANQRFPGPENFVFLQTFLEAELLHDVR